MELGEPRLHDGFALWPVFAKPRPEPDYLSPEFKSSGSMAHAALRKLKSPPVAPIGPAIAPGSPLRLPRIITAP